MNQVDINKQIKQLLFDTHRFGMPELIRHLEYSTDFFVAPASTKHHGVHLGGLAEHSLRVYDVLVRLDREFDTRCHDHHMVTVALLHDLCKANYYVVESRWRKDPHGKWESYNAWTVKDQLPLGHGEKSLHIVNKFLGLDEEEALAIRWHMGAWTAGATTDHGASSALNTATDKYPLVPLLQMADFIASRGIGRRGD